MRYNWPISAHASQAFSIAHCTDSEDLPSFVSVDFDFYSDIRIFFGGSTAAKIRRRIRLAEFFSADIRLTKIRRLIQIFGGSLGSKTSLNTTGRLDKLRETRHLGGLSRQHCKYFAGVITCFLMRCRIITHLQ